MMNGRPLPRAWLAIPLLAFGCGGDDTVPSSPAFGTLAIDWTIDGGKVPARCQGLGSNGFEAQLYWRGARPFVEIEAPCDDFRIEVDVAVGTYFARTRLVDPFDRSATTQVDSDYFEVRVADVTRVSIDFPPSTFLGRGGSGGEAGGGAAGEAGSSE